MDPWGAPLALLAIAVFLGPWALAVWALVREKRLRARLDVLEARLGGLPRRLEGEPAPAAPPAAPVETAAAAGAEAAGGAPLETVAVPETGGAPAGAGKAPAGAPATLEERIALTWFARAGALALILGTAWFFKYAVDNRWIGPAGRVAAGALAGVAALAAAEGMRARTRAVWANALLGTGVALLFVAAYASHALYRLVPVGVAFAAAAVVALLGGALAVRRRAEAVLSLSLAGGLLAPVLLSTAQDRPAALFGYLLVLTSLALAAAARLGFRFAPWLAVGGTALLFLAWYVRFFEVHPPPLVLDPDRPAAAQAGAYHALGSRAVPIAAAVAFLGQWAALGAAERRAGRGGRFTLAVLLAALVFGHAALVGLLHDRPWLLAAALAALAAGAAALLRREGRVPFLVVPAAASFLSLAAAVAAARAGRGAGLAVPEAAHAWLAAASAWALAWLAVVGHAWAVRREPPSVALVSLAAGVSLGAVALVIGLTLDSERVLRAALLGAAGAADLLLGAAALARARRRAAALLGLAIGLFAGAAAALFSGVTVTLVWAALAALAAALAAREGDRLWLAGASVLFAAALLRLAAVDLGAPGRAEALFLATQGRDGLLRPAFLLNPRAYALAGTAAALLAAAWRCSRAGPPFRAASAAMGAAGHLLLVVLAVLEARGLAFDAPVPPGAGDRDAFLAFSGAWREAVAAQAGRLDMVTTLVLGLSAALLVGAGFAARSALQRWLGIALFAATLGKLTLWDVWRLPRLHQVAVLVGVGFLLLAAAWLYARHGGRILEALGRPGGPRGPGALVALLAAGGLAAPGSPSALDVSTFRFERPVEGATAPGLWRFEVDADLYRRSRAPPGSLADLRITGPDLGEVPWALRDLRGAGPERVLEAALVDPRVLPDGSAQATLDLGKPGLRHAELRLDLEGEEFLREVRVETSDDGRRFGVVAEGARVYAVKDLPEARRTRVRYPPSDARWVRVTILPGAGPTPRVVGARLALPAGEPPPVRTLAVPAAARPPAKDGKSRFDLDLGAPGLPVQAVRVRTEAPDFERPARVLASADGEWWTPVGGGLLWRAPEGKLPESEREGLRLAARPAGKRWLRLEVADGDAAPLPLEEVLVEWRAQEVVFRASDAGTHLLHVGDEEAPAPRYDLGAVLSRTPDAPAGAATLGEWRENPGFRERGRPVPFTERHRAALAVALLALLAALAVWGVRLLRGSGAPRE